jgi:AAA domain/UvrD-like helicase C-terminal domain
MPREWSHYQQAIFSAVRDTSDSLLVEAVAGSGKTSTVVEAINYVPSSQRVCLLAFNKTIQEELKRRVTAPNAVCLTLHAAGWAAWRTHLAWDAAQCKVDSSKTRQIVDELFDDRERWKLGQTVRLVGYAKQVGIVPSLTVESKMDDDPAYEEFDVPWQGLVEDEDDTWLALIDHYGLFEDECNIPAARRILAESLRRSREVVDYDDMLMLPVVGGVPFERYDVVFLDEAQDVSGIQMEMVSRMVNGTGRVIAVGDTFQSIYGFRGAQSNSMQQIAERFRCRPLPLSITYRCPQAVVRHARRWVEHLEAAPGADEGVVEWIGGSHEEGDIHTTGGVQVRSVEEANQIGGLSDDHARELQTSTLQRDTPALSDLAACLCTHEAKAHNEEGIGECQEEFCGCLKYVAEPTIQPEPIEPFYQGPGPVSHPLCRICGAPAQMIEKDGEMEWECSGCGGPKPPEPSEARASSPDISTWPLQDFRPGDAILSRVNRPLVALAFRLIRERVPCKVLGREIGKGLVALVQKVMKRGGGGQSDDVNILDERIEEYRQREGKRLLARKDEAGLARLHDQLDTIRVFLDEASTVGEVIREIEGLFGEGTTGVVLSSVHKSKGLEWDRVFILDAHMYMPIPWAKKGWERQGEVCLMYVAATRAKRELRYISSEAIQRRG